MLRTTPASSMAKTISNPRVSVKGVPRLENLPKGLCPSKRPVLSDGAIMVLRARRLGVTVCQAPAVQCAHPDIKSRSLSSGPRLSQTLRKTWPLVRKQGCCREPSDGTSAEANRKTEFVVGVGVANPIPSAYKENTLGGHTNREMLADSLGFENLR